MPIVVANEKVLRLKADLEAAIEEKEEARV